MKQVNLIKEEEEVEERVMIHNMKLILATHSIQNCHNLLTIESIIPQLLYQTVTAARHNKHNMYTLTYTHSSCTCTP